LGDPTRRTIFELLAEQPRSVGELARELPVSRPAVSQHLRALKDGGLVTDRAEGTRRVYQLNPDGVAGLRAYLDRIWGDALAAFKTAVETPDHRPAHTAAAGSADSTHKDSTRKDSTHKEQR
jgi:DNA-binding transcriptional ArsR family regulator